MNKQNTWLAATPAEKRPLPLMGFDGTPNKSPHDNVGPRRMMLLSPTLGLPQVQFRRVLLLSDDYGMQNNAPNPPLVITPMTDGTASRYHPNINSIPEKAASSSLIERVAIQLAPVTPAKVKERNDLTENAMNNAVEKELREDVNKMENAVEKKLREDVNKMETCTVHCCAPVTPAKGKTSENNRQEEINQLGVSLTKDENRKEGDQYSLVQELDQHEHTSLSYSNQLDYESMNQGRSKTSVIKKKSMKKKHRPKVLKDTPLASKKPVTAQPVTPQPVTSKPLRFYVRRSKRVNSTDMKKKHGPVVLKDTLTSKKPVTMQPVTPQPVTSKPVRFYVRRRKRVNSTDTHPDKTTDTNTVDKQTANGAKIVRRKLDFVSESQSPDECSAKVFTELESHLIGSYSDNTTNSRTMLTLKLGQGLKVEVEESKAGVAFDLNHSRNQILDEYIRLPENLNPHLQPYRRGKGKKYLAKKSSDSCSSGNLHSIGVIKLQTSQNQANPDCTTIMALMPDGVSYEQAKNYDHADNAQSCSVYHISSNKYLIQPQVSDILVFPQECKRRRTMIRHPRKFCQMTQRDSNMCFPSDEQNLTRKGDMLSPHNLLGFGPNKRVTKKRSKRSIRPNKSALNLIATWRDQPLENTDSQNKACMEALFKDSHIRKKAERTTRKQRVHPLLTSNIHRENEFVYFPGQEHVVLTSASENLEEKNFHDLQNIPLQHCQWRSNDLEPKPLCTDLVSQAIVPYINQTENYLDVAAETQSALVSYGGRMVVPYTGNNEENKVKHRAKVDLDVETTRMWKILMGKMLADAEGSDLDGEERWEEQRLVFRGRADLFISRMRLIQGDRQFSPWKGSVLDSVIGVFLTQNVSDHLSSSAFMALASKFPLKPTEDCDHYTCKMSTMTQGFGSITSSSMPNQENVLVLKNWVPSYFIFHNREVEQNKMDKGDELVRIDKIKDDLEIIGCKDVNVRRRGLETPDGRMGVSTKITANSESEEKWSLDGAVSAQNSFLSNVYSNNSFQNINFVGSCSVTLHDTDMSAGTMINDLNGYALSLDHIQISGANSVEEIHNQEIVEKMFAEKCTTVDQNSENITRIMEGLNIIRDSCQEISCASSSRLDSIGAVPFFVSESSDSDNIENVDRITTRSTLTTMFSYPGEIKTDTTTFHRNCKESSKNSSESSDQDTTTFKQTERKKYCQAEKTQHKIELLAQKQHRQTQGAPSNSCDNVKCFFKVAGAVEPNSKIEVGNPSKFQIDASNGTSKANRTKSESLKTKNFDWASLQKEAYSNGCKPERSKDRMDSLDWEALRNSDVNEISETIKDRGMNNVLAGRIKDFLDRLDKDHGSLDLEWLRNVPPEKAKEYLLSIRGLGLKSVECVRLLTLHQHAFPVDTNVGRICVRLGWVPLQPLPDSIQLHLLESYPILETIQKYLWPRLCTLDQRTLYELHYQMITFGKVFCTKIKPNCNACPMRGECRHFASAWTSSRLLQGREATRLMKSRLPIASGNHDMNFNLCQTDESYFTEGTRHNNEPIIEEPPSPEPEGPFESEIEEVFCEDSSEIPTIDLSLEDFTRNLQNYVQENMELQAGDIEKAIVAITREAVSIPAPKLKNLKRLRTEHQVYELPDGHPLLEGLEPRVHDDPCPYLLSIWTPGETANSTEPPQTSCNFQETGKICKEMACFACCCRREELTQTIRGTLLIPCRTANRGCFPLNGTYFQVNEVFADHQSSYSPLIIPRRFLWNLPRRIVYFGTSIPTLFRGLSIEEIQHCFSRGFVCVRGFDRETRAPKPLSRRLHQAASHAPKRKKYVNKAKQEIPIKR